MCQDWLSTCKIRRCTQQETRRSLTFAHCEGGGGGEHQSCGETHTTGETGRDKERQSKQQSAQGHREAERKWRTSRKARGEGRKRNLRLIFRKLVVFIRFPTLALAGGPARGTVPPSSLQKLTRIQLHQPKGTRQTQRSMII